MNVSGQALNSLGIIDTRTKEGRLPQCAQELGRRENKSIDCTHGGVMQC